MCVGLKRLFGLLFLLTLATSANAQSTIPLTEYSTREFAVNDGLLHSTVSSIVQDSDGFLWLGSPKGLYRFDGQSFLTVDNPNQLIVDVVDDIAIDSNNRVWVVARNGVFLVANNQLYQIATNEKLSSPTSFDIHVYQDFVYVSLQSGIAVINSSSLKQQIDIGTRQPILPIQSIGEADGLPDAPVYRLQSQGNTLLVGTSQGFFIETPEGFVNWAEDKPYAAAAIGAVELAPDGSMLVGYNGYGLVHRKGSEDTFYVYGEELDGSLFMDVIVNKNDPSQIWVIYLQSPAQILMDGKWLNLEELLQIDIPQTNALYQDHEGSLWIGGYSGLKQIIPRRIKSSSSLSGFGGDAVAAMTLGPSGNILLGTSSGNIIEVNDRRLTLLEYSNQISAPINGISQSSDGMWVSTLEGLYRLENDILEDVTADLNFPTRRIHFIYSRRNGEPCFGTRWGMFCKQNTEVVPFPKGEVSKPVYDEIPWTALEVSPGMDVISKYGGSIEIYQDGELEHRIDSSDELGFAAGLLTLPDGRLYAFGPRGTAFVNLVEGRLEIHITSESLERSPDFNAAQITPDGAYWLGTNQGLLKIDSEGNNEWLYRDDGLPDDQFMPILTPGYGANPSMVLGNDLWFGTIRGPIKVPIDSNRYQTPQPNISINSVKVVENDGEVVVLDSDARQFTAGFNRMDVEFSVLSFRDPDKVRIRFQLVGYDTNWIESARVAQTRSVIYTGLTPGEYSFRIMASLDSESWPEDYTELDFAIVRPFYLKWWFVAPAGLLSLALLVFVIAVIVRRVLRARTEQAILSRFLSPEVVDTFIKHPDQLDIGGEKKEVTLMFLDVENYTKISEDLDPQSLAQWLNELLSALAETIEQSSGVISKFEGDSIFAFWNAPRENPNHVNDACYAALRIQSRMVQLREKWNQDGRSERLASARVRIGLNTGNAVVGNMGSDHRMYYTATGDATNTAARLEGANKLYGTYVIVSESVVNRSTDGFAFRELDTVYVLGKSQPVTIYELVALI